MCGITGRISNDGLREVEESHLRAATRLIVHRGPDGEGLHRAPGVGLGHRRLAIVDLSGGAQPLCNEDQTVWVTFNGEIYNHVELREQLQARGHTFVTRSDTEVLVHGWEEWREGLPTKLRGMFAFGIWDAKNRTFFAARDRLGKKPFYWTRAAGNGDLIFGSEVKSLFAFPDVPRQLRAEVLPEYLALRYVPGADTMFAGIHRLEPGHWLRFRQGALEVRRYWDVPLDSFVPGTRVNEEEEKEKLRALFEEAVRVRLMGEVPVGVFLSGGIDSTAVTWAMRRANPAALKSFSVGFDGDSEGELAYARMAAQALGTEHREVRIGADQFRASLEDLAWHLDEPNADGACIPLMHLAKRAREEVVVVLSGEGADEILGGYGIYRKMLSIEQAQAMGGPAFKRSAALARRLMPHPKVRKYLGLASKPLGQRYFGVGRAFNDELLHDAFGPSAHERLVARYAPLWERTVGKPALNRLLYTDTRYWLPDDLLVKADKMTMAWAIELRVPFLDHKLLEYAWGLPPTLKRRGGVGKYLLRQALKGHIPAPILERPKKGFPVPIGRWLRTSLYGSLRDTLLSSKSGVRAVLETSFVERLLEEHRTGRVDRTEELYTLWVFEAWHRTYMSSFAQHELHNRVRLDSLPPAKNLFGRAAAGLTRSSEQNRAPVSPEF